MTYVLTPLLATVLTPLLATVLMSVVLRILSYFLPVYLYFFSRYESKHHTQLRQDERPESVTFARYGSTKMFPNVSKCLG
ncbi:hypothetical protein AAKU64_003620 [Undibacterium sp. GrIS 1.8]